MPSTALFKQLILILLLVFKLESIYALEILFSRYSVSSGLSSNFVNCLWQDPRGLMWVGTDNGLQRFDGSKFTDFYRISNRQKLPALPVHQIMGDAKGNMWIRMGNRIGTFNTFNYTFNEARVISNKPIPPKSDYYLRRDYKGNFLLTIYKLGIFIYNEKKHAFEENRSEFYVPSEFGINHSFEDKKTGNYWLSTDKGLALFNYKEKKIYTSKDISWCPELLKEKELHKNVTHLHIDKQRRYWIVSWANGYPRSFCYDEKTQKFLKDTAGLNYGKGYYEIENFKESRGVLWAYGLHFLKIYSPEERGFIEFYTDDPTYGIKFNHINHIFEDKEKNVWLATDNGIYVANLIFDQSRHGVIKKVHYEDVISSALETADGRILLSTLGRDIESIMVRGPLYRPDPAFRNRIYKGQPKGDASYQMVWDIHEHQASKSLLFACEKGRLIQFDLQTQRSAFLNPPIFANSAIRQICEDKQKNLWFGTESGRIIKWIKDGDKYSYKLVQELGVAINKIAIDKSGQAWVATEGKGLFVLKGNGKIIRNFSYTLKEGYSLSNSAVKDILQMNDSLFYVAAGNLDIINSKTGKIKQLTVYDGLPFTGVSSLQLDRFGDLWFSTIGGICSYNAKRGVFREYDQKDGLVTVTSADNLPTVSTSLKNTRLLFAGGNSFVSFDPNQIKDRKKPYNVTITDFKLFNNPLPVDSILDLQQLELEHDQSSITIEAASLSYTHHNKLHYYYMLEGADNTWIKTDGPVAANYPYLPPGEYVFKVKAVNSEGLESESVTSLPIHVKPAFWQTWWFKLFIALVITTMLTITYRLRLKQLLQVQLIRERVARDLHDDMGSTLSTINILSEMAKLKIRENSRSAEEYIAKISDNSVRMMEAMDDIVWSIKPSNDSIQKITARMREFASNILEAKDIDYSFEMDESIMSITLNMEARRDLFLIFKEAINNLAKYSEASRAIISFHQKDRKLILKIEDNGKGFDLKAADSGNGLNNMRKRSEKLKGKYRIESAPNKGTKICLELSLT
ncbi:two-component regulator propeller domain-containing protein [Pedobacter sp. SYSU D00535]|uniref:ligand-binding sensor domain-containing protein n=1 Tax=Pedobacter sp. SYSU D00535 TaxID=2810308 RepID=UPI001A97C6EF|nr:sensor histidine kinase [Pedobacter sp. SYSU D00535]